MNPRWTHHRWLSQVWRNCSQTFRVRQRPPRQSARRPRFARTEFGQSAETLEDRILLATILVDDDGNGDQATIQAAIDAAVAGDEILVNGGADGLHTEAGILVNKDVVIRGLNADPSPRVIVQAALEAGLALDRVFLIESGTTASMVNLTIRHGHAAEFSDDGGGGGILNFGALAITSSTITENSAALDGGGVMNGNSSATLRIFQSTISNNTGGRFGGGIHNDLGSLMLIASTISGNVALDGGGGIDNESGTVSITQSTISGNSAGDGGGGINNRAGEVTITNSTISGNSAGGDGGGIRNADSLVATNSTIVLNRADADGNGSGTGGGIFTFDAGNNPSTLLLNTIVAGNLQNASHGDIGGELVDVNSAFNLIGDPGSAGGQIHGGNGSIVGQDDGQGGRELLALSTVLIPNLEDNGGNTLTHDLVSGSPAIDAGSNDLAVGPNELPLGSDQRNFSRIVDIPGVPNAAGGVDIGAVELRQTFLDISLRNASRVEGASGATPFTFAVFRPANQRGEISVDYFVSVEFQGADADDFLNGILPSGTIVFADGEAEKILTIFIQGDLLLERNESFTVNLTNPTGGAVILGSGSASGQILNDEQIEVFAAGSGVGLESMPPQVIVRQSETGEVLHTFLAYDINFRGGVRVATGDMNRDGIADIITAAGPGGGPHIKVFDGLTGREIDSFFAYDAGFTGGVFVAVGNVTGDSTPDIITGAGAGGGPHVKVFDGNKHPPRGIIPPSPIENFFAYDAGFTGGVTVAAGNVDGDDSRCHHRGGTRRRAPRSSV